MSQLNLNKRGIVWSFTRHLEDLDFADDMPPLSQTHWYASKGGLSCHAGTYTRLILLKASAISEDVNCSLKKARAAFRRMQISRRTKLRIFSSCVKSILLYGSETWLVSNSITQRLETFVNKCISIICSIFWPNTISNAALLNLTNEEPKEAEDAADLRRRRSMLN